MPAPRADCGDLTIVRPGETREDKTLTVELLQIFLCNTREGEAEAERQPRTGAGTTYIIVA